MSYCGHLSVQNYPKLVVDLRPLILVLYLFFNSLSASSQSKVTFYPDPGFYTSNVTLELSAAVGEQIYYTLDGGIPDLNSSLYLAPIPVSDRSDDEPQLAYISDISHNYSPWVPPSGPVQLITVVRARSFKDGEWGETFTASYIVTEEGPQRYNVPLVSLVTQKEHLFDYVSGIYVLGKIYDDYKRSYPGSADALNTPANYTQRGDKWERTAHIELFESNGERPLAMNIGIRMHGGGSRAFQQKTFRLYSRSEYGTSRFRYQLFPNKDLDNYNRLILRNSGQDWMKTSLRDGFMQTLVRHLPFETLAYKPAVLFLNGEFWGIANIRERYDKFYLSTNFDVDEDNIDYLTGNASVEEGTADHYNAMLNYIRNGGVSSMDRYHYVQTQMDTESFKYYNLANIYYNNRDWPHNNIDFWRNKVDYDPNAGPGVDGRWRWMMFDTDFGFAWTDRHTDATYNWQVSQDYLSQASRPNHWSSFLLYELLKNDEFKRDFINAYRDLMNTTFRKKRVLEVLEYLRSKLEPYAEEHLNRWGNSDHRWSMPKNITEWNTNVNYMRRFADEREYFVNEHFSDKFNLGDLYPIQVSVNDTSMGYIRVNKTDLIHPTPGLERLDYPNSFEMKYFEGHPISVYAIPFEGYEFSHWLNDQSDIDSLSISAPTSEIVAVFKRPSSVSVDEQGLNLPSSFILHQNYPNPFNPSTMIQFSLPKGGKIKMDVYDMYGKLLFTQLEREFSAGTHLTTIRMREYSSGSYLIMLRSPEGIIQTRLMTLLK